MPVNDWLAIFKIPPLLHDRLFFVAHTADHQIISSQMFGNFLIWFQKLENKDKRIDKKNKTKQKTLDSLRYVFTQLFHHGQDAAQGYL